MNFRFIQFPVLATAVFALGVVAAPGVAAAKNCWQEKASFSSAKNKYGKTNGRYYAAFAEGKNRKNAFLVACGWTEKANSASAAKSIALKNCSKHSDECRITDLFRWEK